MTMVVEANDGSPAATDKLYGVDSDFDDILFDIDGLLGVIDSDPLDPAQVASFEDFRSIGAVKEWTPDVIPTANLLLRFGEQSMPCNSEGSKSWRECSESERLQPSSNIGQGNGLLCAVSDNGFRNPLSSYQNGTEQAPVEAVNYSQSFNFHSTCHDIQNQVSVDLNVPERAPLETPSYCERSDYGGHLNQDDPFGTTGYNDMRPFANEWNIPGTIVSRAADLVNGVIGRICYVGQDQLSSTEDIYWSPTNNLPLNSCSIIAPKAKDEIQEDFFSVHVPERLHPNHVKMETASVQMECEIPNPPSVGQVSENQSILTNPSTKMDINSINMENEILEAYQWAQNNIVEENNVDDDSDLCILEDMSAPAPPICVVMNEKLTSASHYSTLRNPAAQTVTTHSRFKPYDERTIFRVALQDLTQPKSQANPPDGVLSVPLLKHQRIALSWMVKKETKSACCSGGILADDQGLGKTVSTIALILKERSPSSKGSKTNEKQSPTETLNLDDDDDGVFEAEPPLVKGRPSGGTLIVCPTSVLRQWYEELHNKVTREADLSVLVYHGSNRTKDPLELAKHDVVVTTYAIVSMEVPKQPVVNEGSNQMDSQFKELFPLGKRKLSGTDRSSVRSKKSRKGNEDELLESTCGPLAQVGWFRVVLDEAQSIKNHRTQVARACWGLRAKRRWCLSGTPIQNTIDDLYSYFRFLRHEPYAVFRTFCEQLKVPINRSPRNGYKKLQAVLKTIMLRRTKGTFIDGEPVINLPPKTIELRKVDFSDEERAFYCKLEADSRTQFAEYAAAGTVKQNYVNILLMLLRLRQACDHPLLVKGFRSSSKMRSSIEMAKKLSREKQTFLLSCLEASLAICGICSDPPEEAVVTICGHVFCHQCICEHLIGDGTQCPSKKCKTLLTMDCVFSIPTLRTVLSDSDQPSTENTTSCTDFQVAEVSEPHLSITSQDSSKIKAALHILLSMSSEKPCAPDSEGREIKSDTNIQSRDSDSSDKIVSEKAIVFSQWTGMLDLLEAGLKNSNIQYRRLDGTMPVGARDRAVKDFKSIPQVSVMIMSLKAASLGLNMVAACNVILLDLWWNPTTEDQAIDRAHRIGQTRPVSVYRLTVNDTVEDRILALQQRKRKMVASAFGENESGTRQSRLTVDDLKYLFRV